MAVEYSDKTLERLLLQADDWHDVFKETSSYQALTEKQQKASSAITILISDLMYNYYLRTPRRWTAGTLEELLLDVFPRKLAVEHDFYYQVEPVLTEYFLFLQEYKKIRNAKTLIRRLTLISPIMIENAEDKSSWSFGKLILSEAENLGVDTENTEDIGEFIDMVKDRNWLKMQNYYILSDYHSNLNL